MGYMGIGHMGNGAQWAIEYKGLGHMGNGVKGYGPIDNGTCGQLGTRAWGTWTMGYRPSNVSECQKRCQMSKNQTPRLWRRVTKKKILTQ